MATDLNRVYPPLVDSSIPAFPINQSLNIQFTVPQVVSFDEVKFINVRIVQQSNNKTIIDTNKFFDGIIYSFITPEIYSAKTRIGILSLDNFNNVINFQTDTYYKIQIRFGYDDKLTETILNDRQKFFQWKKEVSQTQIYSEWSNVIITKVIQEPIVIISNNTNSIKDNITDIIQTEVQTENSHFPIFTGNYSNSSKEPLYKYRFSLYELNNDKEELLLATSDWVEYLNNNKTELDFTTFSVNYQFNYYLSNEVTYRVRFDTISKNLYESGDKYDFTVYQNYLSSIEGIALVVKDNSRENNNYYKNLMRGETAQEIFENYCFYFLPNPLDSYVCEGFTEDGKTIIYAHKNNIDRKYYLTEQARFLAVKNFTYNDFTDENGVLQIYLKNSFYKAYNGDYQRTTINGTYYLLRASEKTNYTIWEDLACFTWYDEDIFNDELKLIYEDFTIESGINYKYAIQKEVPMLTTLLRTPVQFEGNNLEQSPEHCSNFQYCYLYNNGIQLKLKSDNKMQSFKYTRLFQKQDSLNAKYPIVSRNALTKYAEFQIGSKITLHDDSDGTFLKQIEEDGYYYNDNLIISKNKYLEEIELRRGGYINNFNHNFSNDNIFMERIYRQYVEEFLNDGGYKLFKSPTEGNFIITLVNVSLTPNQQLGRMIADFTSTAYEIAENTLENLKFYNINSLNVQSNLMSKVSKNYNENSILSIGQVRGAFDGKKTNAFFIPPAIYEQLKIAGLKPQEYFSFSETELRYFNFKPITEKISSFIYEMLKDEIQKREIDNIYWDFSFDNIIQWIKDQEEIEIDEFSKYKINKIISLSLEIYPKYNIELEIQSLNKYINDTELNEIEKLKKIIQLAKYQLILKQYEHSQSSPITLILNDNKEMIMMPSRKYYFNDLTDLQSLHLKYTRPILINYVVEKSIINNVQTKIDSRKVIKNFGQLSGIFTDNKTIIDNHSTKRNNEKLIIPEFYNYEIYKTLNITDLVKEKAHSHIFNTYQNNVSVFKSPYNELIEKINNFLNKVNKLQLSYEEQIQEGTLLLKQYKPLFMKKPSTTNDIWLINKEEENSINSYVNYTFQYINEIEIEADENTEIIINPKIKNNQIIEGKRIIVGPTNKYKINIDQNSDEKDIYFSKPTFATINYVVYIEIVIKTEIE